MLRAFLDTTIIRNSQHRRREWKEVPQEIHWGDIETTIPVLKPEEKLPIEKFKADGNKKAYQDAYRIRYIESLARWKLIKLYWHFELHWEFVARRKLGKGMPTICRMMNSAHSPIYYGRIIASPSSGEDHQFEFLRHLEHPRFDEWKRVSGVVPNSKREKNQLLDAFHLWTAEHNWCDCFVTMDYKLIKAVSMRSPNTELRVMSPSEFLRFVLLMLPAAILERLGQRLAGK